MSKIDYTENFESILKKNFEKDFIPRLFEYISTINVAEYIQTLLQNIKIAVNYIENNRDIDCTSVLKNINDKFTSYIKINNKFDFDTFYRLIRSVPAFTPLVIMFLKTKIYLTKLQSQEIFINSIKFEIDIKNLLQELWGNNLCVGCFKTEYLENVFPIVEKQWKNYPKIQEKTKILAFLYLTFEKAIYLPIEKFEDRFIMDINTLLDTYFYTEEASTSYSFCGPPIIPNAEDKLDSIMIGNVLKPNKYKKKNEEIQAFIDAYSDYPIYKFWYTRLKCISEYFNPEYNNKIKLWKHLNIDKAEIKLLEKDKKFFLSNKNQNILKYIWEFDEQLHKVLTVDLGFITNNQILDFVKTNKMTTFALQIIKYKYNRLSDKSTKRIQNKFSEFNKIIDEKTKYNSIYAIRQLEAMYINNNNRNFDVDPKIDDIELNDEIFLNYLQRLYFLYEQYTLNPTEYLYNYIQKFLNALLKA